MNLKKSQQPLSNLNKSPLISTSFPFKVSVVICAYTIERLHDIHEAVASVLAQSLKPYEVIVSVDHNEELCHRLKQELPPEVKVVLNKGVRGSAEARNAGIRFSTGDIAAFIDDDAIAGKDWLGHLMQHYQDPSVIAVGGRIVSVWRDGRPRWFPEELDWIVGGTYKGYIEAQTRIRNLLWPNMSFRREVCNRIGFIRTDLGALGKTARAGDETEFCMRISHHIPSAIILHEPNAIVYHKALPHQTTLKHLILRSFNDGKYKGRSITMYSDLSQNPLSTERSYLRYLLFTAIPQRLRYFYRKGNLSQVGAIMLSIAVTGVGYMTGKRNRGKIKAGVEQRNKAVF